MRDGKLRHRKVTKIAWGPTASKWWSQDVLPLYYAAAHNSYAFHSQVPDKSSKHPTNTTKAIKLQVLCYNIHFKPMFLRAKYYT